MPKKVMVIGGSGMLGSMVVDYLSRDTKLEVTATVRTKALAAKCGERLRNVNWQLFDGNTTYSLEALSMIKKHDWVINAIGITKPLIHDDNAFEVEQAIHINSLLPYAVAHHAQKGSTQVLQIATDCVYSGSKGKYVESDVHDALDVYGKTKSLGEVSASHVHHLRCSIVGPEPKDHKFLLDWFLSRPRGACINGYVNQYWNGMTTLHFAKLCHSLIIHSIEMPHLHHVVPTGEVTKCELLQCFAKYYGREDISISHTEATVSIDRTLTTTNEILNRDLWSATGYSQIPSVTEMVAELADYKYRLADLI